jgi:hypothetical protein
MGRSFASLAISIGVFLWFFGVFYILAVGNSGKIVEPISQTIREFFGCKEMQAVFWFQPLQYHFWQVIWRISDDVKGSFRIV